MYSLTIILVDCSIMIQVQHGICEIKANRQVRIEHVELRQGRLRSRAPAAKSNPTGISFVTKLRLAGRQFMACFVLPDRIMQDLESHIPKPSFFFSLLLRLQSSQSQGRPSSFATPNYLTRRNHETP